MFFVWVFAGFASPASMVRVMAAQNTEVMRKSIVLLSCYNCLIYIPLIMTCIAARSILPPEVGADPDQAIPRLSLAVTQNFPMNTGQFVSGLILAAPFGAIMASVSCFILVIASGLVEDIYAKFINPSATDAQLRRATQISMITVGCIAILAVINPPKYLQALVVLSGSAGAATFIAPVIMACYWRRANAAGALAGMLGGFLVYFAIYSCGWAQNWAAANESSSIAQQILGILGPDPKIGPSGLFRPYYVLGVDPIIWGLLASIVCGIAGTLLTNPPSPELVSRFFDKPASTSSSAGTR
jgi:SSS family solute:Na+ symporter/sodium/pantothenate symporter